MHDVFAAFDRSVECTEIEKVSLDQLQPPIRAGQTGEDSITLALRYVTGGATDGVAGFEELFYELGGDEPGRAGYEYWSACYGHVSETTPLS